MSGYQMFLKSIHQLTMGKLIDFSARNLPWQYRERSWAFPGLNHGKAVLKSEAALNSYMVAYGEMHTIKMKKAICHLPIGAVANNFEIVDWGCGQGIATVYLLQTLTRVLSGHFPRKVTLIDASCSALDRADMNVRKMTEGQSDIFSHPIWLDDVFPLNIVGKGDSGIAVHLLSNIIDVEGVNLPRIGNAIFQSQGEKYVICVGHGCSSYSAIKFQKILLAHGMERIWEEYRKIGAETQSGHKYGWDIRVFHYFDHSKRIRQAS